MSRIDKPQFLEVKQRNIPKDLKALNQWMCWKGVYIPNREKWTKVPFNPITGKNASSTDPTTWTDFKTAYLAYKKNMDQYDGIGFVLTKDDPYAGWDLDDCRDVEAKKPTRWADEIITALNSYSEISPSGTGYRILVKAGLPPKGRKKGKIEVYQDGRYLTITGHRLSDRSKNIENRQEETTALHQKYFATKNTSEIKQTSPKTAHLDEQALLKKAFGSKNGDKIQRLFNGDYQSAYPSPSEADQALCNYLAFWLNGDPERIDRVFRNSGLFRKKWDERHYSDGRTYGQGTIDNAITSCKDTYSKKVPVQEGWGTPVDIFSDIGLIEPKWERYYCPKVISEFAYDEAERMGVLPEQIAGPAIVNAASVINDKFKIQPKEHDDTWDESARLFGAVIGKSGEKKSPAKDRADRVLKSIQNEFYVQYEKEMVVYKKEMRKFNSLSKKEQLKASEPTEPVQRRIAINDTTIEALRDLLKNGGGASKLACLWDELSGWLGSFDAYRQSGSVSKDRPLWLELYNGGPKYIDRVKKGHIYVPNWSACISGTITPEVMTEFFGNLMHDGLLQRFLLYKAKNTGEGQDRIPNDSAISRYEGTLKDMVELMPNGEKVFKLGPRAQGIRKEFETTVDLAKYLQGATEAFKAHLYKYSGMFCRLALTFHITDAVSRGKKPYKLIPTKIARMAASVLIEYHMPMAWSFYKTLRYENKIEAAASDLCGFLLALQKDTITSSEILQGVRKLKKKKHEIQNIMDLLEAYNWVRVKKLTRNRPTQWYVNPEVHKCFAERAETERERREQDQKKIKQAAAVLTKGENDENVSSKRKQTTKVDKVSCARKGVKGSVG